MPFGTEIEDDGGVLFRIFAPAADSVKLRLEGAGEDQPMGAEGNGWYTLRAPGAKAGSRYRFVLPDGTAIADPASRYQPEDVHGPSEVIDPGAYEWHDEGWKGRPWEETILYELHVGTFTPQGTFRRATEKLDHLQALGVTTIELMCLSDFAGNRNWGYDGVLLYAPDSAYGPPDDMKAFVDAAHARGITVVLDVVYNHFGPEGNDLSKYFPQVCSERHKTPWGQALNFDGDGSAEVRELILQNALYWISEFHIDGLRLDASHALIDESSKHILEELRERVLAGSDGRHVHLILENEDNIAERLTRGPGGQLTGYTAQWNHDITHLLAAVLGAPAEERGEGDSNGETEKLGKALAEGFVIAAQEKGRKELDRLVPPTAFVAFIQTHDLVGNRIFGDRIYGNASTEAVRAIAAIYLLLPQIPMLFMGEEWATPAPFPFFCDYHGDLAEAVKKGRCEQLSKQDPAPSAEELERAPDPQAESTMRSAQLRWEDLQEADHAAWLDWYKRVLQVRHEAVIPLLRGLSGTCGRYEVVAPGALKVTWTLAGGARLHLAANLCVQARTGFGLPAGEVLWVEGREQEDGLGSWSVRWSVDHSASATPECDPETSA